ncbi:MAG: 50S ribosomal protein L18 [Nitrospinaceae bacterium]|nr:50S ribosomal protein L18 [Nitrospinaceae bacterium]MBT3432677.1 50S ribosomal protein L18 [Nitrospinaceae bacterium]MBT3820259.1 50S ribosomal protein L18 [Nitrospinaceae bacterium]MBT4095032.1 50S ribosomal protein L18 [Nitrospinaceae bacterium]MBT4429772.1 50S ribosomal protein L18 [Nitrospinaceae bacterium]
MPKRTKRESWLGRKTRVRKKLKGVQERPRLSVFRSSKHIYAQIINDIDGATLAAASSQDKEFATSSDKSKGGTMDGAVIVGKLLGDRAKAKGVEQVVFDRNGYLYHGRVKALADAVRETGVKF